MERYIGKHGIQTEDITRITISSINDEPSINKTD